jgi:hypothetical protein
MGIPLPQYSRGPIATAFPLVFILMKLVLRYNWSFSAIPALFLTMVENSLLPRN